MPADPKALRKLLAKATPGPWGNNCHGTFWSEGERDEGNVLYLGATMTPNNAALIVAAVNSLPELLDELERLREN